MERIEDLLGATAQYGHQWLPARPEPMYTLPALLRDLWLVMTRRATAVQWPDQRPKET